MARTDSMERGSRGLVESVTVELSIEKHEVSSYQGSTSDVITVEEKYRHTIGGCVSNFEDSQIYPWTSRFPPCFSPTLIAGPTIETRLTCSYCSPIAMITRHGYSRIFLVGLYFVLNVLNNKHVTGHGRLMDPPARNSMWRFGFSNPVNYNDNELFCGGFAVQWIQNQGQCGVCGDAYHLSEPRPHEAGGKYAKGTIVRHYTVGQEIDIEVELTANHMGRFELYLCPNNNPTSEATQECFDRYPLYVSGTRDVRFEIPLEADKKAIFRYRVRLPPYVTCTQCVIQWTYYTGNMWGTCENGTEAVGCGMPETFRNCADVSIVTSAGGVPPPYVLEENPFLLYYKDITSSDIVLPLIVRSQVCVPTFLYRLIPGMNDWCQTNCVRFPPFCPEMVCHCPEECDAIGELRGKQGANVYCMDKCLVYVNSTRNLTIVPIHTNVRHSEIIDKRIVSVIEIISSIGRTSAVSSFKHPFRSRTAARHRQSNTIIILYNPFEILSLFNVISSARGVL
ncbi:hypothetical protein KPH14_004075 [Odynerus spinipes]|uniref:Chitin-binding type-4 domain-containing protein n=1 Tax=Odynerus spinipes TaxID=1348599 RepID=A0AAD9RY78_9HYME|nr:hypothetical protein KPH14_004075 [Odynerus spinipes]